MHGHFVSDSMHIIVPRASGVDVQEMQLGATVCLYGRDGDDAQASVRIFNPLRP